MQDGSDIPTLMQNVEDAEKALDVLSQELPLATKAQKFAVGNEKSLLSTFVVKYIKAGSRPALAETLAWADPDFQTQRATLTDLWEQAEKVIQARLQDTPHNIRELHHTLLEEVRQGKYCQDGRI